MARQFDGHFPKSSTVFWIEWKAGKAIVTEFSVVSRSTASVTLADPKGRQQTITGRKELQKFAATIEDAVLIAFREICDDVSRDGQSASEGVRKAEQLAAILER